MKPATSHAPELHVRDRRFTREALSHRWWMKDDPIGTAFYNALSAALTKAEPFFIETVRKFRGTAPAELIEDITAFTTQELLHTREHVAFNRRVDDAGYDMGPLEAAVDRRLNPIRAKPPIASLAVTMALEHYTAIIAHELLANPTHLEKADPEAAAMWRWHALDEIEHKAVAYDMWLHETRDWSRGKRWWVKTKVMMLCTRNFMTDRFRGGLELLRQDGITGPAAWARLFWFWFVRPGIMRKVWGAWLHFFAPGFHPWNHDNRAVVADARKSIPGVPVAAAEPNGLTIA